MKRIAALFAVLTAVILNPACTVTGTSGPPPVVTYVEPAVIVAAASILQKEKTEAGRAQLSLQMIRVADVLALASAPDLTGADITAIVIRETKADARWTAAAALLGAIYDQYRPQLNAQPAEIVRAIVSGLRKIAVPYLPTA